MKILIKQDGSAVVAVYNDRLLPLLERLGVNPEIKRRSEVEWERGRWSARLVHSGDPLTSDRTREGAIDKEHDLIEADLSNYA